MTGHLVILTSPERRQIAKRIIDRAPDRAVVTIRAETRTGAQNRLLWSRLTDISLAKPEGRSLTPDVWKSLFLHSLDHSIRFEPALDGNGMVPMGFRSSQLTKAQMADLITVIEEYGARHNVRWSDEGREAA